MRIGPPRRPGTSIAWVAIMSSFLFTMAAFAIDLGWIALVRNQLQVAADAGAMAGAAVLAQGSAAAKAEAEKFAELNPDAGQTGTTVTMVASDIEVGTWDQSTETFTPTDTSANCVKVTTRKRINLFFGRLAGMSQRDVTATAFAIKNPRDIAFVVDLSGSMNNDSEIWATSAIDARYNPAFPNVGTALMANVFQDFGFGSYPGTTPFIGQVSGANIIPAIPSAQFTPNGSGQSPIYGHLVNTYLVNNLNYPAQYRIAAGDNDATRKQKAYSWLIDYQLAPLMTAATPAVSSASNYNYWAAYLDYCINPAAYANSTGTNTTITGRNTSRIITQASNPYPDAWPTLTSSTINWARNRVGYQNYVQFMMDFGRDVQAGGRFTPMSINSADCDYSLDTDPTSPGFNLTFPAREQPTHAVRLAVMAGINAVKEVNVGLAEANKDHVCVITFDTAAGINIRYPLTATSCDYDAARVSVRTMQATSDFAQSTASENGLLLARQHLNPATNPAGARPNSTKILVFLTDGLPNIKQSSDATVDNYVTANPTSTSKVEWFPSSASFYRERNACLMQANSFVGLGWKTFSVGVGLGCDTSLLDRMARTAGTGIQDPSNPTGPLISSYAAGNPADYQQRLTSIFAKVASTPSVKMVK